MSKRQVPDWRVAQVAGLAAAVAAADRGEYASGEEVRAAQAARTAPMPSLKAKTRETPDPARGQR